MKLEIQKEDLARLKHTLQFYLDNSDESDPDSNNRVEYCELLDEIIALENNRKIKVIEG